MSITPGEAVPSWDRANDDISTSEPMIIRQPFPNAFLLNFSNEYSFGEVESDGKYDLAVAQRIPLSNGVVVSSLRVGMLCFDFTESHLGKKFRLLSRTQGIVPDAVMANNNEIVAIQQKRLRTAVFLGACIYGCHAGKTFSPLASMRFPNLADICWVGFGGDRTIVDADDMVRLAVSLRRETSRPRIAIANETVEEGLALANRLLGTDFRKADPVQLMAMAYQAMVLHSLQHPSASLALSAVAVEAATNEIFWASGIVSGTVPSIQVAIREDHRGTKSRNASRSMNQEAMITCLHDAGVFDRHLREQTDALRLARNALMHRGTEIASRQSGEALTTLRDVLQIVIGCKEFELNASWTIRF